MLRASAIGAVAGALVLAPPATAASLLQSGGPAAGRFEERRLEQVPERLERQGASQPTLDEQLRALTVEIQALERKRERVSGVLRARRQHALALEQRLDYLVPRLLAREAEVRERRARTAQALAELATRSRQIPLDSTERARLLAIGPLMVERLRTVEGNLGSVRRPDQAIEHHAAVRRSLASLGAARERLAGKLAAKRRQRQAALERLGELDADLRLLADGLARLTHRLRGAAAGIATLPELAADQPPRRQLAEIGEARVPQPASEDDASGLQRRPTPALRAEHRSTSEMLAAAPAATAQADHTPGAGEAGWPAMRAARHARASALRGDRPEFWPSASRDAISPAKSYDLALGAPRRLLATAVSPGAAPLLLPVAEAARGRGVARSDHPEITIAAAPGQGVVAPMDGRVVFADRFKSYGLLLIIEHEREYHTLLWGFAWLDVRLGDYVQAGQVLGIMGARDGDPLTLHVERRRNGRPVELAASSSGIQG